MAERAKRKIGLVLGSGSARGLAHIGVIKALEEENIPIDMISGSSIGALVGACFARERSIKSLEDIVLKTDWVKLLQLADPNLALMLKGFIHGNKVKELLRSIIGDIEFRDLKIPLRVVATDINTGRQVVIKEGSVIEAVRASISMPVIFMPVKRDGVFLMDGGVANPVPVRVAKSMGAGFVIACNVIHKPQERKPAKQRRKHRQHFLFSGFQTADAVKRSSYAKFNPLGMLNNKINQLVKENRDISVNFQKLINTFMMKLHRRGQKMDPDTPGIFDVVLKSLYTMEYEIAKAKAVEADIVITPEVGYVAALEFYRGAEIIDKGYRAARRAVPKIRKMTGG